MGKVKIGKAQVKNKHTGSPVESAFSKEEILVIAKNVMEKHKATFEQLAQAEKKEIPIQFCQCVSVPLLDKRARQYTKLIKKILMEDNELLLELHLENKEKIEIANKIQTEQKADLITLGNEQSKISHQLELIEQELKVKPVHIKETKTIERFDHRLLIINLVLIFLNIILLIK